MGLRIFARGESFLVWDTDLVEEDTGTCLAGLWAAKDLDEELLDFSAARLQRPLVVEVPRARTQERAFWQARGFALQRYRLARTPQTHDLETQRQGRFRLRLGSELDRITMCTLAAEHAEHTLPPGRADRVEEYRSAVLARLSDLDLGEESSFDLLVAEELSTYTVVGYLVLQLLEEQTALLFDLGVRRSHWGQYVAQFLVRATENLLVQHGIEFFVTEISAANRRSFLTAQRSLNFEIKTEIWQR